MKALDFWSLVRTLQALALPGLAAAELRVDAPDRRASHASHPCHGRGAYALVMVPVHAFPPRLSAPSPGAQPRRLGQKTPSAIPALPPTHLDLEEAGPPENLQVPGSPFVAPLAHYPPAVAMPTGRDFLLQFQPDLFLLIASAPHFAVASHSYTHRGHVGRSPTSWPHFLIKSQKIPMEWGFFFFAVGDENEVRLPVPRSGTMRKARSAKTQSPAKSG